jgi:hypothetical protein
MHLENETFMQNLDGKFMEIHLKETLCKLIIEVATQIRF